jgi:hypothetical protein
VHDTHRSESLLHQLGLKNQKFLSTAIPHEPNNLLTHGGLVPIAMGPAGKYVAMLDDVPFTKKLDFKDWWDEIIFVDSQSRKLSRKELVLTVSNQDGGAHVDSAIDRTYRDLAKDNSLNWIEENGGARKPLGNPVEAAVRQIAHEMLRTLLPDYRCEPPKALGVIFAGASMIEAQPGGMPKVGRNKPCPCGSGQKYKKCHGKPV